MRRARVPTPAVSVPSANVTRPGATATADPKLEPPGIRSARTDCGHAIGRAYADEAGGELIEIGLADDDRAGRPQPRHTKGEACGASKRSPGRRRWCRAGGVDIVLDRERSRTSGCPQRPCRRGLRLPLSAAASSRRLMKRAGSSRSRVSVEAARDGLRGRNGAGAMRGDKRCNGFSQLDAPSLGWLRFVRVDARSSKEYPSGLKQAMCHCVHYARKCRLRESVT